MTMRHIVLNADDFGYDPAVTRGISHSILNGVVSSTTVMVNTPYAKTLRDELKPLQEKHAGIGLHFNLAKFAPLSEIEKSVLDANGELDEKRVAALTSKMVLGELEMQFDKLQTLMGRVPSHIDVHKHLHQNENVLRGLIEFASQRKVPVRSITENMRNALRSGGVETNDVFLGDTNSTGYWTLSKFNQILDQVPKEGFIELMCHPGYTPSEVKSGYAAQREVELATFVSKEARTALEARNIQFMGW